MIHPHARAKRGRGFQSPSGLPWHAPSMQATGRPTETINNPSGTQTHKTHLVARWLGNVCDATRFGRIRCTRVGRGPVKLVAAQAVLFDGHRTSRGVCRWVALKSIPHATTANTAPVRHSNSRGLIAVVDERHLLFSEVAKRVAFVGASNGVRGGAGRIVGEVASAVRLVRSHVAAGRRDHVRHRVRVVKVERTWAQRLFELGVRQALRQWASR